MLEIKTDRREGVEMSTCSENGYFGVEAAAVAVNDIHFLCCYYWKLETSSPPAG